jgi:hypothetical protein
MALSRPIGIKVKEKPISIRRGEGLEGRNLGDCMARRVIKLRRCYTPKPATPATLATLATIPLLPCNCFKRVHTPLIPEPLVHFAPNVTDGSHENIDVYIGTANDRWQTLDTVTAPLSTCRCDV